MAEPTRPTAAPHEAHDLEAVAALAAGDLAGRPMADAEAQVADCPDCRSLHADLAALSLATRALRDRPAPTAPRDFRITPAQAARLRRRPSITRRVAAAFAGIPRLAGGAVAAAGLALVVLGASPAALDLAKTGAAGGLPPEANASAFAAAQPAASPADAQVAATREDAAVHDASPTGVPVVGLGLVLMALGSGVLVAGRRPQGT